MTINNRVNMIDGIRGFSLFGILMANLLIFQYGLFGKDEISLLSLSATDLFAYKLIKIFIEGSFMPIFTFLFGYGMIKMKESLERKELKVKRHFVRRFIFLGAIGLVHSTLLWEGDILLLYGMMGFFLLLFMNRKSKTVLVWGIILLLLTSLFGYGNESGTIEDKAILEQYVKDTFEIYGSGTYNEITYHRNNVDPLNLPDYMYIVLLLLAPIASAPLFLLGMYAAKKQRFTDPAKEQDLYIKYALFFVPIGLLLKSLVYIIPNQSWVGIGSLLGANMLSLGYIYLMALGYKQGTLLFKSFEAVGKLSMTNYLLQTVICTTIFYGYGFGLFGKLGIVNAFFLGIIIYSLQVSLSYLYLKRFRSGPFEKMIRIWTYFTLSGKPRIKASIENKRIA
ncbi:DUF418 domain-containing protein [Cytobacillus sp. IB215665]|uniref:DUF418 domain-containing protein n=1 Tax=Cytobacillus sp. IB215665 TaxID=3097357 RepID=UPI002A0D56C3|nr:DUF418 domain-containing protein [Cytobacillus sp. IB215665]MDX8367018.1 DUF418 domain-containing protein [Cytobacillus sp. IB215665]